MDSKRFPNTSGNLQDTSNEDCAFHVDAPLAVSATLVFAQGTTRVKYHLEIPYEYMIDISSIYLDHF